MQDVVTIDDATLYHGDCLEILPTLDRVDAVVTDPPYGTTACKWDEIIPLKPMWKQLSLITKKSAAILVFGSEPFSSALRMSNAQDYKYDLYWKKEKPTNFMQLKRRFGKTTENVCVFYKSQCTYNPQKFMVSRRVTNSPKGVHKSIVSANSASKVTAYKDDGTRYPCDILEFNRVTLGRTVHPTQKPVDLLEYLIKSYTNESETVPDFTMGSGTTGVACANLGRKFIGIELERKYFDIACERIDAAYSRGRLFA